MEQKNFQNALRELRELEKLLDEKGKPIAAAAIQSQIKRLEVIGNTHLKDLSDLEKTQTKRSPLYFVIINAWEKKYPKYGRTTVEDRVAVERLISDFLNPVYPNAGGVLVERTLDHFEKSTEGWVVNNKTLKVFAKNFKRFIDRPLKSSAPPVTRSDGF